MVYWARQLSVLPRGKFLTLFNFRDVHVCCGLQCIPCFKSVHTERIDTSNPWFDLDKVDSMNRKELQQLCKNLGIRANSQTTKLICDLKEFHKQHLSDSTSVLHSPFIVPVSRKISENHVSPANFTLDKNLNLFSPMESPTQWISGEVQKLHKTVKSKGITKRSTGEYKGTTKDTQSNDDGSVYLGKNASVSSILNGTSNKLFMISRWQKQQIELMGKENFKKYKTDLSKCGLTFHSYVNSILQGKVTETCTVPKSITGLIQSISKADILNDLTEDKILSTEEYVTHCSIGFSGTFDCLAIYKGSPCVIEWKTSQNPRPSLQSCYDAPLQVVAYAGAINSYPGVRIPVTNCLIVIAHHDGSKADVHWMNLETCKNYWLQWLLKVIQYKQKLEKKTALKTEGQI